MPPSEPSPGAGRFATTHWSCVLAARDQSAPGCREALAALCATYWYPLYAYARRRSPDADQARDLTQEFFARLLEKDFLLVVDRERGKFRSFLLAAFRHFLSNEHDRATAGKRGGGRLPLALDFRSAEGKYRLEPVDVVTPEKLFERRWALTLLDQTMSCLREEYARAGNDALFNRLKGFLTGEDAKTPYRAVADALAMTEGGVKVAVHRLRKRYRALLREEIAKTVDRPDQIDDEIRDLFAALG